MATLYMDLDNGTDGGGGTLHDGLKEGNYAAIASTDNTHTYIAQGDLDNDSDDNYNGDYIYNVTRSLGALISDYDGDDEGGNSVLTHAEIVGNVDTDTFYILRAIKTIAYYTNTLVRSAGDILYVRANTTQAVGASDVVFDEDGTTAARIKIIGCDASTNDPWGDASDVKPVFSFGDNANQFNLYGDDFWWLERLEIKESADPLGGVYVYACDGGYIKDCKIYDCGSYGVVLNQPHHMNIDGCEFEDNGTANIDVRAGSDGVRIFGCTIDAGAEGTTHGLWVAEGARVECTDSTFGQTNSFGNADINLRGMIYARNCTLDSGPTVAHPDAIMYSGDDDGVYGAHKVTSDWGTIEKDTDITRSGGADSSAKMLPASDVSEEFPLDLNDNSLIGYPFKIWTAAALTTVTVYIRSCGTWGTYPTADELYLEANYLDEAATSASRATVVSNDVLSHSSNWQAFDVTFTPTQEGFVYLNVTLGLYEDAGDGCYVDIKPVVS